MKRISLNGEYLLRFVDEQASAEGWAQARAISAQVPGNVEIDLMNAGILPDIFFGNNVKLTRPYEFYRWRYERAFEAPALEVGQRAFLRFEGVDLVADYYLNGERVYHSENALIEHRFEVTDRLREGRNELAVTLASPILHAARQRYDAYCSALTGTYEALKLRKAPSAFGWDIMPRTVSAGLWRGVWLEIEQPNEIEEVYLTTLGLSGGRARILCTYRAHTDVPYYEGLALRIEGWLHGERAFSLEQPMRFVSGRCEFEIENPQLWWPAGYGEPALYQVTLTMLRAGRALASATEPLGVRTVELRRTEVTDARGGEFCFVVNGQRILCKGSNWVPADALHSRDAGRYGRMLEMWSDTGCNILRAWGGGVYEDHAFFDECDRRGIMVWQDFCMACSMYPLDEAFLLQMRQEAEAVVTKLRNHPSIVLWSGDNECDAFTGAIDPGKNRITREVLPQVITRLDPYRPYLPSSPYVSEEVFRLRGGEGQALNALMPEDHLWGPRDYFKSSFYTQSPTHFVSETGYHGCNNLSSIRRFISPDKLWPWKLNDEWLTHASEMYGPEGPYAYRIQLMADQIHELFGIDPEQLEDFILASQISQAEAKKFFIELTRCKKWRRTGVIWWNMIDGWPQFSDAVVSYDFEKKLAYHYIKRSQQPLCLMMAEPENWHARLMAGNDTLRGFAGRCRVWDGDTGETLYEGRFEAAANATTEVARIRISHGDQRLLLMNWRTDEGMAGANHYVVGTPPLSFERYRLWLDKIARLDGAFDVQAVGK